MQKSFERQRLLNKVMATPGPFPYVLILDHLKVDFNIGKIIRSAEAFGARAVDVVGTSFFDPLPAKGCMKRVSWKVLMFPWRPQLSCTSLREAVDLILQQSASEI